MSAISLEPTADPSRSDKALRYAAAAWLIAALCGQWAFFYYIMAFYGASIVSGDFSIWNRLQAMGATAHIDGDTVGNLAFLGHALGAGIVALGGALQFIPQLRSRAPRFHHWNGRVFVLTVIALSVSGLYLVWVRGTPPDSFRELSTTFNGLFILAFAVLAYRSARQRNFVAHRRWALRLYLVSNAQWFLRIGAFSYFILSSVVGHSPRFSDPFFALWAFGCYLMPLLCLEVYLWAKSQAGAWGRTTVAAVLGLLTLVMLIGVIAFGLFSQRLISGMPLGVG